MNKNSKWKIMSLSLNFKTVEVQSQKRKKKKMVIITKKYWRNLFSQSDFDRSSPPLKVYYQLTHLILLFYELKLISYKLIYEII